MSYFDFADFFKIAETASNINVLGNAELLQRMIDSLPNQEMKPRMKQMADWLALEQLYVIERKPEFEHAAQQFFAEYVAAAVKSATETAQAAAAQELSAQKRQYEAKLQEARSNASAWEGKAKELEEQRNQCRQELDGLRERKDALLQENKALTEALQAARTASAETMAGQTRNQVVLAYDKANKDPIQKQLNRMTAEQRNQVEKLLFAGPCVVPPLLYNFPKLTEVEYESVNVIPQNAFRVCPALQVLKFHDKDCAFHVPCFADTSVPKKIIAPPGGSVEQFAREQGIRFEQL
jgi:hypothetical protein